MRRREFIGLVGGAGLLCAAKARRARAQQPSTPVIGFLDPRSLETTTDRLRAFRQGLKDAGYVEGDNVAVEYRLGDGQFDRLPVLAAELVRRPVAVIVAGGSAHSAFAGKAATTTIPIVFAVGEDPVQAWPCGQPCPARRQPDRYQFFQFRGGGKAAGNVARASTRSRPRGRSR